jgi:hypothetical protein
MATIEISHDRAAGALLAKPVMLIAFALVTAGLISGTLTLMRQRRS